MIMNILKGLSIAALGFSLTMSLGFDQNQKGLVSESIKNDVMLLSPVPICVKDKCKKEQSGGGSTGSGWLS